MGSTATAFSKNAPTSTTEASITEVSTNIIAGMKASGFKATRKFIGEGESKVATPGVTFTKGDLEVKLNRADSSDFECYWLAVNGEKIENQRLTPNNKATITWGAGEIGSKFFVYSEEEI